MSGVNSEVKGHADNCWGQCSNSSRCVMIMSGAVPAVNELKVIITTGYVLSAFSLSPPQVCLPLRSSLRANLSDVLSKADTPPQISFHKGQPNLKNKSSCPHTPRMQIKEDIHIWWQQNITTISESWVNSIRGTVRAFMIKKRKAHLKQLLRNVLYVLISLVNCNSGVKRSF